MELYIIRHADPDYPNNTITEFGRKEAAALAPYMAAISPDLLFASPLGRAQHTAQPTCDALGKSFEVLPWTAESMAYMQMPELINPRSGSFAFSYAKGFFDIDDFSDYATESEERSQMLERLMAGSDELLERLGYRRTGGFYVAERANDMRVAVFCHGGFGSAWIAFLMGLPPMFGWQRFRLKTGSITKFVFDNSRGVRVIPYCEYLNNDAYAVAAGLHEPD